VYFFEAQAEILEQEVVENGSNVLYNGSERLSFLPHPIAGTLQVPGFVEEIEAEYFDAHSQSHHHPDLFLGHVDDAPELWRKVEPADFCRGQEVTGREAPFGGGVNEETHDVPGEGRRCQFVGHAEEHLQDCLVLAGAAAEQVSVEDRCVFPQFLTEQPFIVSVHQFLGHRDQKRTVLFCLALATQHRGLELALEALGEEHCQEGRLDPPPQFSPKLLFGGQLRVGPLEAGWELGESACPLWSEEVLFEPSVLVEGVAGFGSCGSQLSCEVILLAGEDRELLFPDDLLNAFALEVGVVLLIELAQHLLH
jgi:hypothetical protein